MTVNGGGDIEAYGTGKSSVSALSLGGSGGNGGINITGGITSDTPILVGVEVMVLAGLLKMLISISIQI